MRRAGNVVLASDDAVTTDRGYQIEQRVAPIPALANVAAAVGAVTVERDPDGAVRRAAASLDQELYRAQKWSDAEHAFRDALGLDGADGPSRVFAERCARYAVAPPPQPWNGVYVMTTK